MIERISSLMDDYRQTRAMLRFLDANLWIGRPRNPEFASGFDIATLRQRMERYNIYGGLVSHFGALAYGAGWANEELLKAIEGTGLWACITLLPEMFWHEAAGESYLAEMIKRGTRAARVFPATHNFSLRAWCSGALLEALAAHCIPLVLWHTETSWEEIRSLCQAYPQLPIIVEGTPRKILYYSRFYYPLLEQCSNLYLELHNLVAYLGIEDLVSRFGAQRLVFGSFMPVCDPNATLMQVTHARISQEDKMLVARENLAQLIAGVKQP